MIQPPQQVIHEPIVPQTTSVSTVLAVQIDREHEDFANSNNEREERDNSRRSTGL